MGSSYKPSDVVERPVSGGEIVDRLKKQEEGITKVLRKKQIDSRFSIIGGYCELTDSCVYIIIGGKENGSEAKSAIHSFAIAIGFSEVKVGHNHFKEEQLAGVFVYQSSQKPPIENIPKYEYYYEARVNKAELCANLGMTKQSLQNTSLGTARAGGSGVGGR